MKARINQALQDRKNCHCPIIGADEKSKPYLVGTGVVLYIDSKLFIASAAHVLDENAITTMYTFLNGKQQIIEGEVHVTTKPENDRNKDKIDVAIFRVSDRLIPEFRTSYTPVTIEDIEVNDIPASKKYYSFIGHPTNKTNPKYGTTKIKRAVYSFFGNVAHSNTYDRLSSRSEDVV